MFVLLALPFFFTAACFGLAFMYARDRIPSLYASDLLGAGVGAAVGTALLLLLDPADALRAAALAGAVAAMIVPVSSRGFRFGLPVGAVVLALAMPAAWLAPRITEFKGLPRALQVLGASVDAEFS
ncbi:MAG: hypothetical protein ACREB5_07700, partial [Sphingomonadaceae bacterium]